MSTIPRRPATLRQSLTALSVALLLFVAGIIAARMHSVVCIPLMALATLALLWGARRPATMPPDR